MIAQYARQAALVVKVIPLIEKEDAFALKGGTAINLFELDMPRLSVDIDLTFTRITDRETAITKINAALGPAMCAAADLLAEPHFLFV